jgi:hypothetical protein
LAVESKKTFLDIAYGFPVIVMIGVVVLKKIPNVVFSKGATPTHDDYGKP